MTEESDGLTIPRPASFPALPVLPRSPESALFAAETGALVESQLPEHRLRLIPNCFDVVRRV